MAWNELECRNEMRVAMMFTKWGVCKISLTYEKLANRGSRFENIFYKVFGL